MPFDNPKVEIEVPHQEELRIVDKMIGIIASGWCQGKFSDAVGGVCMYGALNLVDSGNAYADRVGDDALRVSARIRSLLPTQYSTISSFNDSYRTTKQDVLSVLRRTRASFE